MLQYFFNVCLMSINIVIYICTFRYSRIAPFLIIIPPLFREGLYCNHLVRPSVRTDFSAIPEGIHLEFCIHLHHHKGRDTEAFQIPLTSTSCLAGQLRQFSGPKMHTFKIFVTDFSASIEGIDFKCGILRQHDELYCASLFQVCRISANLTHIL